MYLNKKNKMKNNINNKIKIIQNKYNNNNNYKNILKKMNK